MTKLKEKAFRAKRKRIINAKECENDLKDYLEGLFESFWGAVCNYEKEVVQTPIEARCRGFEASLLNSKILQSVQSNFKEGWKFGKYKRFMLRINSYIVFFKKLNNKDMPMNIQTRFSSSLQNQEQGKLFDISDDGTEPILFFGYNKDRFGNICNPKLVYIDEGKVSWTITESDIERKNISLVSQVKDTPLSVRQNKKREGTNN
ncbi:hypothetical protein D0T49_10395 [Paludibacter sp. 221]|uniref:hypothetical protein n=1 Tax=Paludibacter sp. 221 TaxID=2302939 RepID=UPI0013D61FC5|nr:hypothetical protein [Paludibacter sp. 221]NDV47455.1 hypothetical protein [Paludibacter sp. 221]